MNRVSTGRCLPTVLQSIIRPGKHHPCIFFFFFERAGFWPWAPAGLCLDRCFCEPDGSGSSSGGSSGTSSSAPQPVLVVAKLSRFRDAEGEMDSYKMAASVNEAETFMKHAEFMRHRWAGWAGTAGLGQRWLVSSACLHCQVARMASCLPVGTGLSDPSSG